ATIDSPLEEAIRHENTQMVQLFLESGARVPAGARGQELFQLAQRGSRARELSGVLIDQGSGNPDLCLAAATDQARLESIEYCLNRGANVRALADDLNILSVVLQGDRPELVRQVLDVGLEDRVIAGALAESIAVGDADLVRQGIGGGAVPEYSHIESAIENGYPEIGLYLLDQTPPTDPTVLEGGDAGALIQQAKDRGFNELAATLRRKSGLSFWSLSGGLLPKIALAVVAAVLLFWLASLIRGLSKSGSKSAIQPREASTPRHSPARPSPKTSSTHPSAISPAELAAAAGEPSPSPLSEGPPGAAPPAGATMPATRAVPPEPPPVAAPEPVAPGPVAPPATDLPATPPPRAAEALAPAAPAAAPAPPTPAATSAPALGGPPAPTAAPGGTPQGPQANFQTVQLSAAALDDLQRQAAAKAHGEHVAPPRLETPAETPTVEQPAAPVTSAPAPVAAPPVAPAAAAPASSPPAPAGSWQVAPEPVAGGGDPAGASGSSVVVSTQTEATFELHMPEVDLTRQAETVFAGARQAAVGAASASADEQRQVVLVTPARVTMLYPCPAPGSVPAAELAAAERILPSSTARNVAVIAFSDLEAAGSDLASAIPFLGLLRDFGYLGHAVWIFEGHVSAMAAGCQEADVLIVDDGMMRYLPGNWRSVASRVMRGSAIFVFERKTGALRRLNDSIR
ncbi:MAG: hypothetical protein AAF657_14235, partial [Acidobacteriota bacterium]